MATIHRLNLDASAASQDSPVSAFSTPLVFVTGVSRSVTSLVTRMLGAHSAIKAFDSMDFIPSRWAPSELDKVLPTRELSGLAATLLAEQTRELWGGEPSNVERSWGRQVVEQLSKSECTPIGLYGAVMGRLVEDAGRSFACDQAPLMIFYARELFKLLPNAVVIFVVCDPRFALALRKTVWWGRPLGVRPSLWEALRKRVSYHPITASRHWRRAAREAAHLSGHSRFKVLRLEELVAGPKLIAESICKSIGVPFEPNMIELPRWVDRSRDQLGAHGTIAEETVRGWREKLTHRETLICEQMTARLMFRFGYAPEMHGQRPRVSSWPSRIAFPLHVAGLLALYPGLAWRELGLSGKWRAYRGGKGDTIL